MLWRLTVPLRNYWMQWQERLHGFRMQIRMIYQQNKGRNYALHAAFIFLALKKLISAILDAPSMLHFAYIFCLYILLSLLFALSTKSVVPQPIYKWLSATPVVNIGHAVLGSHWLFQPLVCLTFFASSKKPIIFFKKPTLETLTGRCPVDDVIGSCSKTFSITDMSKTRSCSERLITMSIFGHQWSRG